MRQLYDQNKSIWEIIKINHQSFKFAAESDMLWEEISLSEQAQRDWRSIVYLVLSNTNLQHNSNDHAHIFFYIILINAILISLFTIGVDLKCNHWYYTYAVLYTKASMFIFFRYLIFWKVQSTTNIYYTSKNSSKNIISNTRSRLQTHQLIGKIILILY